MTENNINYAIEKNVGMGGSGLSKAYSTRGPMPEGKNSEIKGELVNLSETISRLETFVEELSQKLVSVLNFEERSKNIDKENRMVTTELGRQIKESTDRVENMVLAIIALRNSVEL